jgi:hypothetical protein
MQAYLLSFGGRIAASFVAWFMVWHLLSPRIELPRMLSKNRPPEKEPIPSYGSENRWQIKMRNARRRPAVDLAYSAQIRFRGDNRVTTSIVSIGLSVTRTSVMQSNRLITFDVRPDALSSGDLRMLKRAGVQEPSTLEEVLERLPNARLFFCCFATDSFSGSRRTFYKTYTLQDIGSGRYVSPNPYGAIRTAYLRMRRRPHPTLELREEGPPATASDMQAKAPSEVEASSLTSDRSPDKPQTLPEEEDVGEDAE